MSIENCPLTQIPTEIVSGGPSLVIQVMIGWKSPLQILTSMFSVPEAPRSLQNYVRSCYRMPKVYKSFDTSQSIREVVTLLKTDKCILNYY